MIHPTAILHNSTVLGEGVRIGPYVVIGENVRIGDGVTIGPHAVIEGECDLGAGCAIYPHAVVGTPPQDLKYQGEPTRLEIGCRCVIREAATLNRGTAQGGGVTRIGDDCLLMANSHVAHDCRLGDRVVLANSVALAGHVQVGDDVWFGGLAGVHQFARIGGQAFIAAGAMVRRDVPPFFIAKGDRAKLVGVNVVGLKRRGFSELRIAAILKHFETLKALGKDAVVPKLQAICEHEGDPDLRADPDALLAFWQDSTLGVSPFCSDPLK